MPSRLRDLEERLTRETQRRQAVEASSAYRLGNQILNAADIPHRTLRAVGLGTKAALGAAVSLLPERVGIASKMYLGRFLNREGEAWVAVPPLCPASARTVSRFPTILLVALGIGGDALEELASKLAAMRRAGVGMKPVIVTDSDRFHVLRRHALFFEYIPPAGELTNHFGELRHEAYVRRRMDQLTRAYRPDSLITLGPPELTAVVLENLDQIATSLRR